VLYEYSLYLLKEMQAGMKTIDELKQEIAKVSIAKSMKDKGLDNKIIVECTGLSVEQIDAL